MSNADDSLLRSGAAALLAQGSLHLQLMRVEWALEKLRYRRMLVLVLVGVPLLICALLSSGLFVMLLCWNTPYRFPAAVMLVCFYSFASIFAYYRLRREEVTGADAFADSGREIAADIALLRDRLGR